MTAQLLKANGCIVIGLDIDDSKLALARSMGIIAHNPINGDPVKFVMTQTNGVGADGVIITASAKSNDIISQAAQMSRKRGKIVLVGVIGLDLSRAEFYEKELTFQVSCSYGPGRYDDDYEQKGQDYPLPFVRWTEKRNFQTILSAIASNSVDVKSLITEVVELDDFDKIYGEIGSSKSVASIIKYDEASQPVSSVAIAGSKQVTGGGKIAVIGAGNFTKMTMLPAMPNADIKYVVSKGGLSAKTLASKHNIAYASSNYDEVLADGEVGTVMITTRHDLHASMVLKAIKAGKNVFVEKPLALSMEELEQIESAYQAADVNLMVGFNRRFSPHIQKIKSLVPSSAPKNMIATMNAGNIPPDVWVHDMAVGGGRIIGEACHYIDLLVYLSGSKVKSVCMNALGGNPAENTDNASILLKFENGDTGVVNYFANGSKSYSKERVEVFADEQVLIMDNFRETIGYGTKGFSKVKTKLDKGHKVQFDKITKLAKSGGEALIPYEEIINVTKASFAALQSLKEHKWVNISD